MKFISVLSAAWMISQASWAQEYQVVAKTQSPDGRYALAIPNPRVPFRTERVMFYDLRTHQPISDDLSEELLFSMIFIELARGVETFDATWSPDARRMAIEAAFHQFADIAIYDLKNGQPKPVQLPDLAPEWRKIRKQLRPYTISKSWRLHPHWTDARTLQFHLTGSAYRPPVTREQDVIDYDFEVTLRFDPKGSSDVIGMRRVD